MREVNDVSKFAGRRRRAGFPFSQRVSGGSINMEPEMEDKTVELMSYSLTTHESGDGRTMGGVSVNIRLKILTINPVAPPSPLPISTLFMSINALVCVCVCLSVCILCVNECVFLRSLCQMCV
ncbi:hypothetical protein XENOCAPTIV_001091 [Xenoophorus captivus]|uniref:Uncharacterized protein n=1 Tax=Xenoophorus captivus TaxID=1517983 RepID=A0ABV0QGY7_9TELE